MDLTQAQKSFLTIKLEAPDSRNIIGLTQEEVKTKCIDFQFINIPVWIFNGAF